MHLYYMVLALIAAQREAGARVGALKLWSVIHTIGLPVGSS
jgi:hypothetical protein